MSQTKVLERFWGYDLYGIYSRGFRESHILIKSGLNMSYTMNICRVKLASFWHPPKIHSGIAEVQYKSFSGEVVRLERQRTSPYSQKHKECSGENKLWPLGNCLHHLIAKILVVVALTTSTLFTSR